MKTKTCAFIGNNEVKNAEYAKLLISDFVHLFLEYHNIDTFLFRGEGQFDDMAYKIVSQYKCCKPYIRRVLVLPTSKRNEVHKAMGFCLYNGMLYEDVEYIEDYKKQFLDVVKDNFSYFMIGHSDSVIINSNCVSYPNHEPLFTFALRKNKHAILL